MAVNRMGALQRHLAEAGFGDKVRLLAITYEPQFDTPERINRYATDRGLRLGENALALQLDTARHQQLVDELQAPVNYNAGWVNAHGVELSLLDAKGRLVRKYHTVLWSNDQVMTDVKEVLGGRKSPGIRLLGPRFAYYHAAPTVHSGSGAQRCETRFWR